MSFRLRLTLFFALIVVLPMIALAILVSQIASDSAEGKADARLAAGLRTATNLYEQAQADSRRAAARLAAGVGASADQIAALEAGDRAAIAGLAGELARSPGVVAVELASAEGARAAAGSGRPAAMASVDLLGTDGTRLGTLTASTVTGPDLLERIEATTDEQAAIVAPDGPLSSSIEIDTTSLPASGEAAELETGDGAVRVAASEPLGDGGIRIALAAPATDEGFFGSRPRVAIAVLVFFCVALGAIVLLLRSLQEQIREMLAAARRIGGGDFSQKVPVAGRDEMAGLASEFNKMSDRLSDQMDQLRRQRVEIEKSVQRIGEAFASGLDRHALLAVLLETAIGACDAEYGLVVLSDHKTPEVEAGRRSNSMSDAALAAERRALEEPGAVQASHEGAFALSSSLGRIGAESDEPVGTVTIAREGRSFEPSEREVFLYLLGQASASVENVALHELVAEQAVTDELTGLANKRAFQQAINRESARAERFGHDLSLVILDLDDFKAVNDTYGHLQGDEVLCAVGTVLAEESRGIDVPARYGGEEFVVALPGTDVEGAVEVAERIRARIENARIPLVDREGELKVTASIGTATTGAPPEQPAELLAAADTALYAAKRAGKNRVVAASAAPETAEEKNAETAKLEPR